MMYKLTLIPILMVSCAVAAAAASVKVTLRAEATVLPAQVVALRDIAQVTGTTALARKVGDVMIGVGPLPGKKRALASSYVKSRIEAAGIAGQVTMAGAGTVELVGSCIRWDREAIARAAAELVQASLPQDGSIYQTSVDRLPKEMTTAGGAKTELRARLLSRTAKAGPNTVAVDAMLDGRAAATTSVNVQVRRTAEVLTAVANIRQGENLTEQNTAWSSQDITRTPDAIVRPQDATEQTLAAKRSIGTGSVITQADVTSPSAVKRGDTVILIVKCGSVRLATTAEVKQDRRAGESVSVRPAMSEQNVTGRVVEPGLVEVVR